MPANKFEIESIFTGVDRLSRPLGKMGRSIDRFQEKAAKNAGKVGKAWRGVATGLKAGLVGVTTAGTAAGFVLWDAAKAGMDFEQAIVNAAAVMPGKVRRGTEEFKSLSEAAKEVGLNTEFSAVQAAQGLEKLGMAGFSAKQAVGALPGIIDLATASSTDFAFAADVASDALSAFGLMSKDPVKIAANLARINDVLANSATSANVDLTTLYETLSTGASTMKGANVSFEEFGAMAGVLGSAGIKGTRAGTAMKNIVLELVNPIGQAKIELDRLGVSLDESAAKMTTPTDALAMLEKGFDRLGVTGRKRLATLDVIYKKIGGAGANALLNSGIDNLKEFIKANEAATKSAKATEIAAFKRETSAKSLDMLAAAIEGVKIAFFEGERDGFKKWIDSSTAWVRDHQPQLVSGLKATAGAFKATASAIKTGWETYRGFTEYLSETSVIKAWAQARDTGFIKKSDEAIWNAVENTSFIKRMAEIIEGAPKGTLTNPDGASGTRPPSGFNGIPLRREEPVDLPPIYEPVTIDDTPSVIGTGAGMTSREEKHTTVDVKVRAEPGTSATVDDGSGPQLAPTGGL